MLHALKVASSCPLAVATLVWEPEPGERTLTAIVKATLALVHGGEATLAAEPQPILPDVHEEDDPRASLRAASDWAPIKPRVDVVLVGEACAPGELPVAELPVTLTVGAFTKSLWVVGDRVWVHGVSGLEPGAPTPFTRMSLRYERAPRSADNPIGVHVTGLVAPGAPAAANLEVGEGAVVPCFAPVPAGFRARRARLGETGERWARRLEGAPPPGFDYGFFNVAPEDQQLELLRGGALVRLEHLTPDRAVFETRLPQLRPRAHLLSPRAASPREIALRADTLWIDAERAIATLTFRGLVTLDAHDDDDAVLAVVTDAPSDPRSQRHLDELFRAVRGGGDLPQASPPAAMPRDTATIRWDAENTVTRVRELAPLAPGTLGGAKRDVVPFDAIVDDESATTIRLRRATVTRGRELAPEPSDTVKIRELRARDASTIEDATIADPESAELTDPDGGRVPLLALGISRLGVESGLADTPLDDTTTMDPTPDDSSDTE
jgi:hypothetical protein